MKRGGGGDTLTEKKKVKLDQPARHPEGSGGEERGAGGENVAAARSVWRGRLSHAWSKALRAVTVAPKTQGCKWGLMGAVRAGDLQSAAPAGGVPAQHREMRTPAPATPSPSSLSTWGENDTPQGKPEPQSTAPNPQSPILKPLFLSELSDLRPRRLRLGEAWVQQRPPSDHRR